MVAPNPLAGQLRLKMEESASRSNQLILEECALLVCCCCCYGGWRSVVLGPVRVNAILGGCCGAVWSPKHFASPRRKRLLTPSWTTRHINWKTPPTQQTVQDMALLLSIITFFWLQNTGDKGFFHGGYSACHEKIWVVWKIISLYLGIKKQSRVGRNTEWNSTRVVQQWMMRSLQFSTSHYSNQLSWGFSALRLIWQFKR